MTTEDSVLEEINSRVTLAGYPSIFAEWHSEKVSPDSTIREVQFKVAITRINRQEITKAVHRIGAETNGEVVYVGAVSASQSNADLVLLIFQAAHLV